MHFFKKCIEMKITPLSIPEVISIEPKVFADSRGYFSETYNQKVFSEAIGRNITFVQDNESYLRKAALRGLNYQVVRPQGKLVRVTEGEIFSVAIDIRRKSSAFKSWVSEYLSADNKKQIWIPEGFAHGFIVTSNFAKVQSKVTEFYDSACERYIRFDDKIISIRWPVITYGYPIALAPELTDKEINGKEFSTAELFD